MSFVRQNGFIAQDGILARESTVMACAASMLGQTAVDQSDWDIAVFANFDEMATNTLMTVLDLLAGFGSGLTC